ncbi:hypothetical protein C8R43DRAFT_959103 [Mycena crocata]|nr:hypothetical protein C8R43DRAFT_959103 [Mycena crocata]
MMIEQIHEILCAIIHLYLTTEIGGVLPPPVLYDVANITETLQKVYAFMKTQQGIGRIKKLFKHADEVVQLSTCKVELQILWSDFDVEEFLSLLADIAHLSILVTIRGTERPNCVKRARPFLGPLQPLNDAAAFKTFMDLADERHERTRVEELLALTGNLPLAVNLVANVVSYDGCDATLARWRSESTRVLSDRAKGTKKGAKKGKKKGREKGTNWVVPVPSHCRGLVTHIPLVRNTFQLEVTLIWTEPYDGITDAELIQSTLPIPNILSAKGTLVRTSLVYIGTNHRLVALVPIREHVRVTHPPASVLKFTLRRCFHELLELWSQFKVLPSPQVITQLSTSLGNINSILADGLHQQNNAEDVVASLGSLMKLDGFYRMKNNDISPLMPLVAELVVQIPDAPGYGIHYIDKFFAWRFRPVQDPERQIELASRYFEHASDNERAQWYNALAAHYSYQGRQPEAAMRHREMGVSLRLQALMGIADLLCNRGDYSGGRARAQEAQHAATALGDVFGQAQAIS